MAAEPDDGKTAKTVMEFVVEVPALDQDLIGKLSALPGAKRDEEQHFDGVEMVRVTIEIAAAAKAIAATAKSAAEVTRSVSDMIDTLRSLFRKGVEKYRSSPNGHFKVTEGGKRFLTDDMTTKEVEVNLATIQPDQ